MAPTFVAASDGAVVGSTLAITYPGASVAGDLLVAAVTYIRNTATNFTVSAPAGWTVLSNSRLTPSQTASITVVAYRFRGAETSASWVASTNADAMTAAGSMLAFTGSTVDPTTPIDTYAAQAEAGGGTTTTIPSVTTSNSNEALARFAHTMRAATGAYTHTWASGTERSDASIQFSTFARFGYTSATDSKAVAGSTGTTTTTASVTLAYHEYGITVAINPPLDLDVPVTDSVASAETQQVVANVPATDSISVTSEAATISVRGTDGITRSETAQVIANTPATDATQSAETQQVIANVPATDSTSVSESAYVINVASASDSAQTAESASVTVKAADTATFTETQAGIGQETASFGENQAITVTVSDGISTTEDAFSATAAQGDDGVGSTEQASVSIRGTDSVGSAETQQVIANVPATDGVSVGENQRLIIHVTDSMSSAETAAVRITVADSVSSVDSASVIVTVFATDGMGTTETTIEGVSDSDSATFTENAFRLISGLLQFPRQVKIPADNRRIIIDREPRRVSIDPDYRRTSIRAEVRRHIVIPKDKRVFEIEGE